MYRKRIALFLLGFLLLAALLYNLDFDEFVQITSRLSPEAIFGLLVLQTLIFILMALRWYVIIMRYGVSLWNVLQTSFIGFMLNNLTPVSYAGGEPVRAYVISKIDKIKMEKAFATVLVDLFLTLLPALFIMLLAIFLVFKNSFDLRFAWLLGIIALVVVGLFIATAGILLNKEPSLVLFKKIMSFFSRIRFFRKHVKKIESDLDELFGSFHRSIHATVNSKSTIILSVFMSFLVWILTMVRVYYTFIALGHPVPLEIVIIVYAVLVTVSLLPLIPGALGMWEWVGAGLFTYIGVPLPVSVAFVLIDRLLFYWLPILLGGLSSIHMGLGFKGLMDKTD